MLSDTLESSQECGPRHSGRHRYRTSKVSVESPRYLHIEFATGVSSGVESDTTGPSPKRGQVGGVLTGVGSKILCSLQVKGRIHWDHNRFGVSETDNHTDMGRTAGVRPREGVDMLVF